MTTILDSEPNPDDPAGSSSDRLGEPPSISVSAFDMIAADFNRRWKRGDSPRVEDYLSQLNKDDPDQLVELVYHEYRLAENDGLAPDFNTYIARFPEHADDLWRLFQLHETFRSASFRDPSTAAGDDLDLLPAVGDSIGPYRLIKVLGRGGFAQVYLAEQRGLEDRLVVLKVATKVTQEPSLLARASHPNIVSVISTTMVNGDAFQLICMPFLGGATLSAVLDERRKRGLKMSTGGDLLALVEKVQPAGYPAAGSKRPAWQILEGYSYQRAVAWMTARLADGLHHAYGRNVLHGDIKPSNILITADGDPMLLDFNLAVGWSVDPGVLHGKAGAEDPGGTMAYMAPERLQTVAKAAETAARFPFPLAGNDRGRAPSNKLTKAADRHKADIYSLGVVLLEALTGKAPTLPAAGRALSFQQLASAYISSRNHDGKVMIGSAQGSSLPSDLRAILRHCLAPDPADRYQDASELSTDLDLWLRDRPLLYAKNPGRTVALRRWLRRNKVKVAVMTVVLAAALATTAVNRRIAHVESTKQAERYYSEIVNSRTSGAFRLRRPGSGRTRDNRDPVDVAREPLERYDVISDGDWMSLDKVRSLPTHEREELQALLLEQSLRYAHALGQRPESPKDWQRAYLFLKQIADRFPSPPIVAETVALRIKAKVDDDNSAGAKPDRTAVEPAWINEYLEAISDEIKDDYKQALVHYQNVLKVHPDSFWANYRASAVAFALKPADLPNAAEIASKCLEVCVKEYPRNAILRHQYAGCLYAEKRYPEALRQYDEAQKLNIDNPETYLARAFLRLQLDQIESFLEDIKTYEDMISRKAPKHAADLMAAFEEDDAFDKKVRDNGRFSRNDPEEAMARTALGEWLWHEGYSKLALDQFNQAYALNSDSIRIRHGRAVQLSNLHDKDAEAELAALTEDARFEPFTLKHQPDGVYIYIHRASRLVREGKISDAIRVGRKGVEIARKLRFYEADAHFILATALAASMKTDPEQVGPAIQELEEALHLDPIRVPHWISQEPLFEDERFQVLQLPKPTV